MPWYLSDIILIFIAGSLVKLFKVTSMREIVIFYLFSSIFEVVAAIIIRYTNPYSYDTIIASNFNALMQC